MLTVPQEFKTFRDAMERGLDSMNSTLSNLTGKLSTLSSACTSAQSGFSSYYNSANKATVLSKFSELSDTIKKISDSLSNDMQSILSKAANIKTKVDRMEELADEVAEQEKIIDTENAKANDGNDDTNPNYTLLSTARSVKYNDEQEFSKINNEVTSELSAIKAMNPTLTVADAAQELVKDPTTGEYRVDLLNLEEGKANPVYYTGKNGRKILAYVYLPIGGKGKTGLSVSVSMGGDGARKISGGALTAGVGKQLSQAHAQYSGIIIIPEAEDDLSYSDPKYLDTTKELTDNIVTTYKADPNKISINGYSYGVYGSTHMIERFPGYFSQAVLIGGGNGAVGKESGGNREEAIKKIAKTKVHFICGTNDSGRYESAVKFYNELANAGCHVTSDWRKGADHGTNTFYPTTIDGVKYDNYVEFCLAQSK